MQRSTESWQKNPVTHPDKAQRSEAAPALFRLLADGALSRAALAACGFPVALVNSTVKGRPITYVNPAFEALFGYRADDALGRPVITLLFPEDESAAGMFEAAPARLQMRARRKDGSVAPVELTVGMVHSAEGQLTHWVLAFADQSELARLREELRVLRSIAAAP